MARHRVVIAVPYEDEPNSLFGHVRTIGPEDLRRVGERTGWRADVREFCGGWLVLDRPG